MNIHYFEVTRAYPIACKLFEPTDGDVSRVILGVHGFGGSKESGALTMLAEAMEAEHTALLCFDLPAHGESCVTGEALTVQDALLDLQWMIAYVKENYPDVQKTLFATSFGGFLSLLSSPMLHGWKLVLRAPAVAMPRVLLDNVLHLTQEQFKALGKVTCPLSRPITVPYACYEEMVALSAKLDEADRPMLILYGDADAIVPMGMIETFARSHPQATLLLIPGADHRFRAPNTLQLAVSCAKAYILDKEDL